MGGSHDQDGKTGNTKEIGKHAVTVTRDRRQSKKARAGF
jgi:hypothetical protein